MAESEAINVVELIKEATELKSKGNEEFKKGKMLIKHTAGKNSMTEACTLYAKVSSETCPIFHCFKIL